MYLREVDRPGFDGDSLVWILSSPEEVIVVVVVERAVRGEFEARGLR